MPRMTLERCLKTKYPFRVRVGENGEYVVDFPDLPGCFTGSQSLAELPEMIEEARSLWIEVEYGLGHDIPAPSRIDNDEYSGKFNVRLAHSLHRSISEAADRDGVSMNQYVTGLLARGDVQERIEQRIDGIERLLRGDPPSTSSRVAEGRAAYGTVPLSKHRRAASKRKAVPASATRRRT